MATAHYDYETTGGSLMTEIKAEDVCEGDIIKATHPNGSKIEGIVDKYSSTALGIRGLGWPVGSLERDGFVLEMVERKRKLPTEPGLYVPSGAPDYGLTGYRIFRLRSGSWAELGIDGSSNTEKTESQMLDLSFELVRLVKESA